MYGLELEIRRAQRRHELRQAEIGILVRYGRFLDVEDMLTVFDGHPGYRATTWMRELTAFALFHLGIKEHAIREAFKMGPDDKVQLELSDFLADPEHAARVERRVLEELPETPEPSRGPAAVPPSQHTPNIGGVDPRWQSGGGQPH
jgi:hypothetical protein